MTNEEIIELVKVFDCTGEEIYFSTEAYAFTHEALQAWSNLFPYNGPRLGD